VDLILYQRWRGDWGRGADSGSEVEGDKEWGVTVGSRSGRVGVGFIL
jgi:hypothetical protein